MKTAETISFDAQAASALQFLADRIDTPTLDGFIERLFALAAELECITCRYAEERIRIDSKDRVLHEMAFPRSKSALRMVCARLAVLCKEWSNENVNPYGDHLSVHVPSEKHAFVVTFENTPAQQSITIELSRDDS